MASASSSGVASSASLGIILLVRSRVCLGVPSIRSSSLFVDAILAARLLSGKPAYYSTCLGRRLHPNHGEFGYFGFSCSRVGILGICCVDKQLQPFWTLRPYLCQPDDMPVVAFGVDLHAPGRICHLIRLSVPAMTRLLPSIKAGELLPRDGLLTALRGLPVYRQLRRNGANLCLDSAHVV